MYIVIADNDIKNSKTLANFIKDYIKNVDIEIVCNEESLLAIVQERSVDLIIMSYELEKAKQRFGHHVADSIRQYNPEIDIMIVSDYECYALLAYDVYPIYYFVKPVQEARFKSVLKKWYEGYTGQESYQKEKLVLDTDQGLRVIQMEQINYIEKIERKARIVTDADEYFMTSSLKQFMEKLDERFYMTYQSYVVNLDKISSMENIGNRSFEIKFHKTCGTALLSRYKVNEFKELLNTRIQSQKTCQLDI